MKTLLRSFALLGLIALGIGCVDAPGLDSHGASAPVAHAVGPATITTNTAAYPYNSSAIITWAGLNGTATDWVAIAPSGSPLTTVSRWAYTGGGASGSKTLANPLTAGTYVARAFDADTYTLMGESDPFTTSDASSVMATVRSQQTAYGMSDPILIDWTGMPGNALDWIALAPEGFPVDNQADWQYTNGGVTGTMTFMDGLLPTGYPSGRYVARAYLNDTFTKVAESPVFVIGVAVTTNASTYTTSDAITVTWQNLPGNPNDWVAIAPSGSPATTVTTWVNVGPQQNGSTVFNVAGNLAPGTYVARALLNGMYTVAGQSAPFTVTAAAAATVTTNASTYTINDPITVSWSGLTSNPNDWIAYAPSGSPDTTITRWVYTGGQAMGSFVFEHALTPGTYVARAFLNNSYTKLGESAPFTVTAAAAATVAANASTFTVGQPITVNWTSLPMNANDWVAYAPAGSPDTAITQWVYTGGMATGSHVFPGALSAGMYVARAFLDNTYTKLAESTVFVVQ